MKKPASILGLLAGGGELPILFAQRARARDVLLATAALTGAASPGLARFSAHLRWFSIGQLSSILSFLKQNGVSRAVMLGKVQHRSIFKNLKLDLRTLAAYVRLKDRSGPALLKAVASVMAKGGVRLVDSRLHLEDVLARRGFLTRRRPDRSSHQDARFGIRHARALAKLGVGQTLIVRKNAVVAVEAVEGTDEAIRRAGRLAGRGCVAVKVAGARQDWRFDVPTVGPATIRVLAGIRAAGLVVEAGKTFILRKERTVEMAEKNGIFIWAV
jgi:DUF1009 family protein